MGKQIISVSIMLTAILLAGCKYRFCVNTQPEDAEITINGKAYDTGETYSTAEKEIRISVRREGYRDIDTVMEADKHFGLNERTVAMELVSYKVILSSLYNIYSQTSDKNLKIFIDGEEKETEYFEKQDQESGGKSGEGTTYDGELGYGEHTVTFHAENHEDYTFPLTITGDSEITVRHPQTQAEGPIKLVPLGIYDCAASPGRINITPDSRYIYITLLEGRGFQIFDTWTMKTVSNVQVEKWGELEEFAEGLFVPEYNAWFISQMSTGYIFEYDVNDYEKPVFRRRIKTDGVYTTVIAWSDELDMLAVSNRKSYDVSIIDYRTGEIIRKITDLAEPYGIAFSNDGKYIYIATHLGGSVYKYNTSNWKQEGKIEKNFSAQSYLLITADDKYIYASDLRFDRISVINTERFAIEDEIITDSNPNAIDLTADEKYLIVSARGKNNPESWLLRSPEEGHVNIIDLEQKKVVSRITAGTQPSGIDIAADGSFFAVLNFQDRNFEIYAIEYQ